MLYRLRPKIANRFHAKPPFKVEMSLYVDFSETPPVDTFIYEVSFEQKFWSGLAQEITRSEALKIEIAK